MKMNCQLLRNVNSLYKVYSVGEFDFNNIFNICVGNPSDVKWLKTALHKGTSKDRANAGALLVQSNPIANIETIENLIGFTKITNKNSTDTVGK